MTFLGTAAAVAVAGSPLVARAGVRESLEAIEASTGGRLGVAVLDRSGAATVAYRAGERRPMCSTFKLLAVSAVLSRVDRGEESLDRRLYYTAADLQEYAPIAKENVRKGYMTVGQACAAAMLLSDNTAANLLLAELSGPASVTRYARSLGDPVTRLDRKEPELNRPSGPGDLRDTTTALAMARDAHRLLLGDALSGASRALVKNWMIECQTGTTLIRAGFPSTYAVGDKTGLGGRHNVHGDSDTRNDVAVVWPKHGPPFVVAAYLTGATVAAAKRDAALASVGRVVHEALAR